ncbi:MAG: antibiotic biosynthesis monooxygenase [Acidobacteriota bacterium]
MTVMVLFEARAKPELIEALKQGLQAMLPETRTCEGCQGLTTYQEVGDGQTLVAVEFWDSKEHYEKYFAWRKENGTITQLNAMLEAPPSIRYFETLDA